MKKYLRRLKDKYMAKLHNHLDYMYYHWYCFKNFLKSCKAKLKKIWEIIKK